jgi:hypothetical protein
MGVVDRVWRAITEPVEMPRAETDEPVLIQVVLYGGSRVYPLYLVDGKTRVLRPADGDIGSHNGAPRIDLRKETPAA